MKKRKWPVFLAGIALIMTVFPNVKSAMAYFTAYVTASGGHTITYTGTEPQLDEELDGGNKIVVAKNTGTVDCYIRVRAFAGDQFTLEYPEGTHAGWVDTGDGFWEYTGIVPAGGETAPLRIEITRPEWLEGDFDVTVVQECTPVTYQEDGAPKPADWKLGEEDAE